MNTGKFFIRTLTPEGNSQFLKVQGYILKMGMYRVGIYRNTNLGVSRYYAVDLRDGFEVGSGTTLHEVQRNARIVDTSEMMTDAGMRRDAAQLWNVLLEHADERDFIWPAF